MTSILDAVNSARARDRAAAVVASNWRIRRRLPLITAHAMTLGLIEVPRFTIMAADWHADGRFTQVAGCDTLLQFDQYTAGALDMSFQLLRRVDGATVARRHAGQEVEQVLYDPSWKHEWHSEGLPLDGLYVRCAWRNVHGACCGFFGAVPWNDEPERWHFYQKPEGADGGPDMWAYEHPAFRPAG